MARLPLDLTVSYRPCGDCQACCTIVGIKELDKPNWTRCPHQYAGGCDIYDERPPTCRGYSCLWQAGWLPPDKQLRPDHLGIILDLRNASGAETVRAGDEVTVQVWEVWPGALEDALVRRLLDGLARQHDVIVRRYGTEQAVSAERIHLSC